MDLAAGFFAESLADSLVIRDDHDGGDVTELQRELQRREQERADAAAAAAAAARWMDIEEEHESYSRTAWNNSPPTRFPNSPLRRANIYFLQIFRAYLLASFSRAKRTRKNRSRKTAADKVLYVRPVPTQ